ncbi:MAG: hypothetical protein KGY61_02490 [Desulfobacterales bacterium]|nr:hypothetical protein [Desulfobacterales bacterium]
MAKNFRITSHGNKNRLYLKLSGIFDAASAMELIYALKENSGIAKQVYIETDGLDSLLPFGRDVFKTRFFLSPEKSKNLVFIGDHGKQIAPRGICCLNRDERS